MSVIVRRYTRMRPRLAPGGQLTCAAIQAAWCSLSDGQPAVLDLSYMRTWDAGTPELLARILHEADVALVTVESCGPAAVREAFAAALEAALTTPMPLLREWEPAS